MHRFFKRLTQQVLPAFRVRDVPKNRENKIVANQTFGSREEPKVSHDDSSLSIGQLIAAPDLDVFGHRDFGGHPVIGAPVVVVFPSPVVLQWHQLIDVDLVAIDQPLVRRIKTIACGHWRW
jgi:hypothetical protein